jgi:aminoglycoside 6'-N-acetyltransferase
VDEARTAKVPEVGLRAASPEDLPLLRHWDEQPHVVASDPNDDWNWEVELRRTPEWREQLIGEVAGRAVAFVQIIDPAREETRYWGDAPLGLRAIDIWIGGAPDLGKGYGTRIMQLAIDRCFAEPGVSAILIDPLASNVRARRFYERLGFRAVGPRRFGQDDCLVYRLDRSDWIAAGSSRPNPVNRPPHLMNLPTPPEAQQLLEQHVKDEYQRHHALMVATAMAGYAQLFQADRDLWYVTGLLHDIDFEEHPDTHPRESLRWFQEWNYPEEVVHAVEAHAYGYHGFTTLPRTKLAAALLACDEICGIFYAYRKLNPVRYSEMKAGSIRKKVNDPAFAAKVDRRTIHTGCEHLGVTVDQHIANLINFFSALN